MQNLTIGAHKAKHNALTTAPVSVDKNMTILFELYQVSYRNKQLDNLLSCHALGGRNGEWVRASGHCVSYLFRFRFRSSRANDLPVTPNTREILIPPDGYPSNSLRTAHRLTKDSCGDQNSVVGVSCISIVAFTCSMSQTSRMNRRQYSRSRSIFSKRLKISSSRYTFWTELLILPFPHFLSTSSTNKSYAILTRRSFGSGTTDFMTLAYLWKTSL